MTNETTPYSQYVYLSPCWRSAKSLSSRKPSCGGDRCKPKNFPPTLSKPFGLKPPVVHALSDHSLWYSITIPSLQFDQRGCTIVLPRDLLNIHCLHLFQTHIILPSVALCGSLQRRNAALVLVLSKSVRLVIAFRVGQILSDVGNFKLAFWRLFLRKNNIYRLSGLFLV